MAVGWQWDGSGVGVGWKGAVKWDGTGVGWSRRVYDEVG